MTHREATLIYLVAAIEYNRELGHLPMEFETRTGKFLNITFRMHGHHWSVDTNARSYTFTSQEILHAWRAHRFESAGTR